jgi:DNA-binding MltR family transcriptional regulator
MNDRDKLFDEISSRRFPEIVKFRQALTPESDRGCALHAASYLDGELETLLRARLVDDAKTVQEFFRPDGPLGSFSARIDMAYLLGLIGPAARRDLHLIRKIRNDFGHNPSPINFSDPAIASRCRELSHHTLRRMLSLVAGTRIVCSVSLR